MKILFFILASLMFYSASFSQWTRVTQLPATDIASLYHKDNILYAGGKNIIYFSQNNGLTWDSTSTIPQLFLVTSIIVYQNELYAAAPHKGVFKSPDGGTTWQDISTGIFPDVSDFCEFRGDLYAASLGSSIYKLDPVSRNHWLFFSNGLSSLSANINSIAGNNNALIAGTNSNGLYDYLPANSSTWEERFLLGQISPNEGAYDIITAHDTLFYAGHTGKFYMSTNNGFDWSLFGNRLVSAATTVVNARQALLTSIHFFNGFSFVTAFFYIKKDSLQYPFVNFSVVSDHFTYKTDILGNKLWDASNRGLFFMPLPILPEMTEDDSLPVILPVLFTSFTAKCEGNNVLLTWKTVQEQNSHHFDIERSVDGIRWTVIGNLPAAGNNITERTYSFTDNIPAQNSYYRIAEYDLDGKEHYGTIIRDGCVRPEVFNSTDVCNVFPNPVPDKLYINIVSGNNSKALIQLFDSKGALVKLNYEFLLKGNNQIDFDMKFLAKGIYHLSVAWNFGLIQKRIKIIKL